MALRMQRLNAATTAPITRRLVSSLACRNLFIGGLSYDTNEAVLKDAFESHGELIEVKVICDHKSGKSKGYGFVKFEYEVSAIKALKEMDGQFGFLSSAMRRIIDRRPHRVKNDHKSVPS